MKLIEFLQGNTGQLSSKRLMGCCCIALGMIMKIIMFCYALKHTLANPYDLLDGSANNLIYVGGGLLGIGMAELFASKKEDKKEDSV